MTMGVTTGAMSTITWRRITGGRLKIPNNVANAFFNTMNWFPKDLIGSNMGAPNFFLAPGAI